MTESPGTSLTRQAAELARVHLERDALEGGLCILGVREPNVLEFDLAFRHRAGRRAFVEVDLGRDLDNTNCTGLAQVVGQVQASDRDSHSKNGTRRHAIWANPVKLTLMWPNASASGFSP